MRLNNKLIILFFTLFLTIIETNGLAQASKHSYSKYSTAITKKMVRLVNYYFDSVFNSTSIDTTITMEQSSLVQFSIKKGIIDTFYIWSVNDTKISHWILPFISPLKGLLIDPKGKYENIIVPIVVTDYEATRNSYDFELKHAKVLFRLMEGTLGDKIFFMRGIGLQCNWKGILKSRLKPAQNPDGSYNLPEK
jgi:hypothetical protein